MVLYPGARLRTNSIQVSFLPWLWSFCPKLQEKKEDDLEKEKTQWTQIQKLGLPNQVNRKNGKEEKAKNGVQDDGKIPHNAQDVENPNISSNQFVVLSSSEDIAIL